MSNYFKCFHIYLMLLACCYSVCFFVCFFFLFFVFSCFLGHQHFRNWVRAKVTWASGWRLEGFAPSRNQVNTCGPGGKWIIFFRNERANCFNMDLFLNDLLRFLDNLYWLTIYNWIIKKQCKMVCFCSNNNILFR